jgi:hypothetical protein
MTFKQFISGEFKFESDTEFSLIDNQTTAIIASDRLYSSLIKKRQLLRDEDLIPKSPPDRARSDINRPLCAPLAPWWVKILIGYIHWIYTSSPLN